MSKGKGGLIWAPGFNNPCTEAPATVSVDRDLPWEEDGFPMDRASVDMEAGWAADRFEPDAFGD